MKDYHIAVAKGQPPWSREYMLDRSLQNGMLFKPGEGWSYSNIGYMFVGELIGNASSMPLGAVISDNICKPLGLISIELATSQADFSDLHWSQAAHYDPRWVYHRCLTGTASDATRLLHALFTGKLLKPETLEKMLVRRSLGGPLAGRPWQSCGYSLGLMTGPLDGLGRVIGHSGGGPFSVNAVYHFPDVRDPITVSCFTDGTDEGVAEFETVEVAARH